MEKQSNRAFSKLLIIAGAAAIVLAAVVLVMWQVRTYSAEQKAEKYVQTLRDLMPETRGAVPMERLDNTMPVLSVDGEDFLGIVEMPLYELSLPVLAKWDQFAEYPCRYDGSIYDRSVKIGATNQKGQFDFCRDISVGDTVEFMDAEGNCYSYEVTDLRYEKHADNTALNRSGADLVLFVKNVYDFEYLIISCNVVN